jgi:Tol biopolymer transport system component
MLVSKATNGTQGNGDSYRPSISADGRYIAFNSNASNLIVDDTNDKMDVYVHDLLTGETSRVSVAGDGTQGNNHSQDPSISADGRYVAFSSTASNFVSSEPFFSSIFIHNLETGQTSSVSVNSEGTAANSYSFGPSISGNGRFISFTSAADNLVSGDINESDDIFVHDFQSGQTFLVSVASDGTQGNNDSAGTSVSGDGRYIAFGSRADNLTLVDTKSKWNIFLYDRQLQQTELISISSTGVIGNRGGALPNISADGNRIVYYSDSDNLVCGDNNSSRDIFLYDRLGILELHSISGTVTTREMKPIPNVRLSNGEGDEVLTDGNGNYKFEQLLPCSYQVTPSLDEYNFSPVSRDITVPPSIENKYFTGNRRVYSFLPSITSNYCGSSYEEDFNNPNSGWPIGEDNYAAFDYLNGEYRIVAKQANMWAAARKISKSENLRTGVEVRTVNSIYGTYGLMFNLGEDWSHFYSFEIDPDGYYGIFRYSDAKGWKLLLVDYSPHIKTESAVNKLGVKRNGALIEVYANDHLLATIKDDSFIGKHYVGLIVTSYDQGYLDVRYDNFFIIPSECGGTTTLSMPGTTRLSTTSSKFFIQEGSKELH